MNWRRNWRKRGRLALRLRRGDLEALYAVFNNKPFHAVFNNKRLQRVFTHKRSCAARVWMARGVQANRWLRYPRAAYTSFAGKTQSFPPVCISAAGARAYSVEQIRKLRRGGILPSGAKAHDFSGRFSARLKSSPDTVP